MLEVQASCSRTRFHFLFQCWIPGVDTMGPRTLISFLMNIFQHMVNIINYLLCARHCATENEGEHSQILDVRKLAEY